MSMQCPVRSVMVNKYYANHTLVIFIAVKYYKVILGASLVVQWLRIHLPVQETWV